MRRQHSADKPLLMVWDDGIQWHVEQSGFAARLLSAGNQLHSAADRKGRWPLVRELSASGWAVWPHVGVPPGSPLQPGGDGSQLGL